MVFCFFCDGQGVINKAKIVRKDIQIYICEKCDTMWETKEIRKDNCKNFKKFMSDLGLQGLWEELTDIERL